MWAPSEGLWACRWAWQTTWAAPVQGGAPVSVGYSGGFPRAESGAASFRCSVLSGVASFACDLCQKNARQLASSSNKETKVCLLQLAAVSQLYICTHRVMRLVASDRLYSLAPLALCVLLCPSIRLEHNGSLFSMWSRQTRPHIYLRGKSNVS